jgi:hypothetical protein
VSFTVLGWLVLVLLVTLIVGELLWLRRKDQKRR